MNSVDYAVSRTAAKRCISINTIVESEDILIGLNARKLKGDEIEVLSTGPGKFCSPRKFLNSHSNNGFYIKTLI